MLVKLSAAVSFVIVKAVPAVWLLTVPVLPSPALKPSPGKVTNSLVAAPAKTVTVPESVEVNESETARMTAVPALLEAFVILEP